MRSAKWDLPSRSEQQEESADRDQSYDKAGGIIGQLISENPSSKFGGLDSPQQSFGVASKGDSAAKVR